MIVWIYLYILGRAEGTGEGQHHIKQLHRGAEELEGPELTGAGFTDTLHVHSEHKTQVYGTFGLQTMQIPEVVVLLDILMRIKYKVTFYISQNNVLNNLFPSCCLDVDSAAASWETSSVSCWQPNPISI